MANIKDFIKKIGNSAVSLEEQQQALAQVEQTIIEAKQKRTEAIGKNAEMVVQALKTIEAKLEAKLEELNNTPAKQGIQGPAGKDGRDGKDGKNGRDGVNGKDGKDGKDGVDGNDGVSVIDAKIDFDGSLVVYLSNGNEIDCGQILQPEVAKNIIISSGGSGTSQVVTDTLVSLQNQINTLTGIDGVLGDMAQQNANAVAITGGTINGTTIGATTPSTGNFTTLTAQTEVLRGTGQNLLLQSGWAGGTSGTVGSGAVAPTSWSFPFSGGTVTYASALSGSGNSIRFASSGSDRPCVEQLNSIVAGLTYSIRFRIETVTSGSPILSQLCTITNTSGNTINYFVNGIAATGSTVATSGTDVQIVFIIGTLTGTNRIRLGIGVNSGIAGDITLANPQVELGSTANTYIPTTTTAVYGTPTLSFSGVSTIGLEQTGALYLQPAGTGAIQAQATTSTSAGGNARGANAVDWQTSRTAAARVASGQFGVLLGGTNNSATGYSSITVGGEGNQATSVYGFIGGGASNTNSGYGAFIGGGFSNTAAGYWNTIVGGQTNSGTANAAVTTQAAATNGVTNGSTAVTLSGSNANIKVGQLITGTGIVNFTYVAAISGTSLTLSQNANATGTPTLSFFTPHGVVVGGGNNQATGAYSFIGGGGDAGTSSQRNIASGDWSVVSGGANNTASGLASVVVGGGTFGSAGSGNTASGTGASVLGGWGNVASGTGSSVLGGNNNTSNASRSTALGSLSSTRAINGIFAMQPANNPITTAGGINQTSILILARQTTDATATVLCSDTSAAGTTNQVILPNNSAYYFTGEVVSGITGGGNSKGWEISGLIKRGANAAATTLVGSTVTSLYADVGASTWTIALAADTTNGGLKVTFTGQAGTTIRTVCQIRTTEMTY